jgi:hypothetical protein
MYLPSSKGLRISELLYAPNNLEYVELHNIGTATLDLSGVRFTQGISYTFDAGVSLAPNQYLVVCRDRTEFQTRFGTAVPLAARTFAGTLDNAGETIAIQPAAPWNVNILNFKYDPTWYGTDTDAGYALTLINDAATAPLDWNDRSSWSPSPALYGTPGADSPPTILSPLNVTGYTTRPFNYQIAATKNPGSFNAGAAPHRIECQHDHRRDLRNTNRDRHLFGDFDCNQRHGFGNTYTRAHNHSATAAQHH